MERVLYSFPLLRSFALNRRLTAAAPNNETLLKWCYSTKFSSIVAERTPSELLSLQVLPARTPLAALLVISIIVIGRLFNACHRTQGHLAWLLQSATIRQIGYYH